MKISEIKRRILHCINKIYEEDSDLFERANYEVTISTKLAQYLFLEFKEYDVDCEYDKHINDVKFSTDLNKNIRPDIVIHKRGIDKDNLVFIEIKKEQNRTNRENDYEKLRSVTKQITDLSINSNDRFKYKLGVFVELTKNKEEVIIRYFENGEESI
ncbi:MAG: hypothetical protein PHU12_04480 [Candidatus Aenigmarchaeota archaeon]|nr:hypothetical protein [Candidatus Aenigmarchaeota archaeon]